MALRDVAIAGVYSTRQARRLEGLTSADVTLDAIRGALADAGLTHNDVDGVAMPWPGPGGAPADPASWARVFGKALRYVSGDEMDCAGIRGISKAAAAVSAGLCETVILGGGRAGPWSADGKPVGSDMGLEFSDGWGAFVPAHFALLAQRHMYEFGTTPENIATAAATVRNNGHENPEAVMYGRGPYTVDDVLASPLVASPLHLLDLCLVAEGGAAVVITTLERARDLPKPPVAMLGFAGEVIAASYANPGFYRDVRGYTRSVAGRAFGSAGVGVTDVDVFSLYDPNAFEIIHQLEILGLCGEGEGGEFLGDGSVIGPKGAHPVNLDGGLLSYTWTGTQQMTLKVVDCVRQLRGEAAVNQLDDVDLAVASNAGSAALHYEVMVLGRAT